ncbi:MAG: thioredoxin family protein [Flavobacteriales bacterium]
MALTETIERELGYLAPDFRLTDVVTGQSISMKGVRGEHGTVVMFICNHCPYVVHVRKKLVELANQYQPMGISFIAISSNDVEKYPQDGPGKMRELALELEFPFPYLYDESQDVARAFDAACTPDFSVFDADLRCVYRGRMDDSTPGNGNPVTGSDLAEVCTALIEKREVVKEQFPSMGCNIKWK